MRLCHSKGAQFKNSNIQIMHGHGGIDHKSEIVILKLKYLILLRYLGTYDYVLRTYMLNSG